MPAARRKTSHDDLPSKARQKTPDARLIAPEPVIDSLKAIGDPYKINSFDISSFLNGETLANGALDYECVLKFLYTYNGSSATYNAYRRELERLLQWSWRIEKRSVTSHAREHIEDFVRFAMAPPPAWIGTKNVARFRIQDGEKYPNPDWRPFVVAVSKTDAKNGMTPDKKHYQPSQASIQSIFAVLSSFYDYLVEEKHIEFNPVALIRQRSKFIRADHNAKIVRRITNLQWDYVIETAQLMAEADPGVHERTLFIMNCLFAMYLRVSELVADERSNPTMGDFRKDQDGNWWFHVTGKGNKDRTIVVSNEMLESLRRYRASMNLPPLPAAGEKTVLLRKTRGHGPISSTRQVRRIVQDCFDAAFERMKEQGLEDDANDLRTATVHWLRHTGISEDVKTRPREHVRDDAGHATMATTDRYIESDRRERHMSGKKKPLKDL